MKNGNFRYPNISAPTSEQKIAQIHSYLYQLADELNYAIPQVTEGVNKEQSNGIVTGDDFQINGLTMLPVTLPTSAFSIDTTYTSDHSVSVRFVPTIGVVLFVLYAKLGGHAISANTSFSVGTIADKYRPRRRYALSAYSAKIANAVIDPNDGSIRVVLQNSVTAGSNYDLYVTGFWFI